MNFLGLKWSLIGADLSSSVFFGAAKVDFRCIGALFTEGFTVLWVASMLLSLSMASNLDVEAVTVR